jgi:hypothetical protein
MEHPAEMLLNNENLNEKQALFELVFEKMPTYDQILNGTPKLTLVFELSTKNKSLEHSIARVEGIEPPVQLLESCGLPLTDTRKNVDKSLDYYKYFIVNF